MRVEAKISLDTPLGYLEDVPAEFFVDVDKFPAEPYSWGESRGVETEVTARFHYLKLGGLTLNENELGAWIGAEEIEKIETFFQENFEHD